MSNQGPNPNGNVFVPPTFPKTSDSQSTTWKPPTFAPPQGVTFKPKLFAPSAKNLFLTSDQDKVDSLGGRHNLSTNPTTTSNATGFDSNFKLFRVNWPGFEEDGIEKAVGVLQSAVGDGSCMYNSIAKDSGILWRYNHDNHVPPIFRDTEFLRSDTGVNGISVGQFLKVDFNDATSLKVLGGKTVKDNRHTYVSIFKSVVHNFIMRPYLISTDAEPSTNILDTEGFDNILPSLDDGSMSEDSAFVPISEGESTIRLFRNFEFFRRVFLTKLRDSSSFSFKQQSHEQLTTIYDVVIDKFVTNDTPGFLDYLNQNCIKRDPLLGKKDDDQRAVKAEVLALAGRHINPDTERLFITKDDLAPLKNWGIEDISWFTDCAKIIDEVIAYGKLNSITGEVLSAIEEIVDGNYIDYVKKWKVDNSVGDSDAHNRVKTMEHYHAERYSNEPDYVKYLSQPEITKIYTDILEELNAGGEKLNVYKELIKGFNSETAESRILVVMAMFHEARREMGVEHPISDEARSFMTEYSPIVMDTKEEFMKKVRLGKTGLFDFLHKHQDVILLAKYCLERELSSKHGDNGSDNVSTALSIIKSGNSDSYINLKKMCDAISKLKSKIKDQIHISSGDTFDQWQYDKVSFRALNTLLQGGDGTLFQRIHSMNLIDIDTGLPVTKDRIYEIFSHDYRKEKDFDGALFSHTTKFSDQMNFATDEVHVPDINFSAVYYQLNDNKLFTLARPDLQLYSLIETFKDRYRYGGPPECTTIGAIFGVSIHICETHYNFLHIKFTPYNFPVSYKGVQERIFIDRIGAHFQSIGVVASNEDEKSKYAMCVFPSDHPMYKESSTYNIQLTDKAAFALYAKAVEYKTQDLPKDFHINTTVSEGTVFAPSLFISGFLGGPPSFTPSPFMGGGGPFVVVVVVLSVVVVVLSVVVEVLLVKR